jgi:hypothetical protein
MRLYEVHNHNCGRESAARSAALAAGVSDAFTSAGAPRIAAAIRSSATKRDQRRNARERAGGGVATRAQRSKSAVRSSIGTPCDVRSAAPPSASRLVGLDQQAGRLRVGIALLRQDAFERPHARLHVAELGAVMIAARMIVIVVMIVVPG